MAIPQEIKKHRPVCTEIRSKENAYYVYKISSKWDPVKKKSKKVTGDCIGKITAQDGFIKSKRLGKVEIKRLIVKEYGCEQLFISMNKLIYEKLQLYFSDIFREIFILATVRLMHITTNADIKQLLEDSWLSEVYKDVRLSENTLSKMLNDLGERRSAICKFMKEFIPNGETLLFDGTSVFTKSSKSSLAQLGYNSSKKKKKQIRLLYLFAQESRAPAYYRLLPGNIVDKAAFVNILKETGVKDSVVIGDRDFCSTEIISYLDQIELNYVLPLRSNTKYIDEEFHSESDSKKFNGFFMYKERPIWYTRIEVNKSETAAKKAALKDGEPIPKNKYVCIFRDDEMRNDEDRKYLEKIAGKYDGFSIDKYHEEKSKFGQIYVYCNMDISPEKVYLYLKGRWDIEVVFNYLKNTLDLGTVNQQSNEKIEAWAFLNHISIMMFYTLHKKLMDEDLLKKYSAESIIEIVKGIHQVRVNDDAWYQSECKSEHREVLNRLGVNLYT